MRLALDDRELDALADALAARVIERLRVPAQTEHRWLTTPEAADYLRTSIDGIHRLTGAGTIPHSKINGRCLFDRHALDAWLEGHATAGRSVSNPFPTARKAA